MKDKLNRLAALLVQLVEQGARIEREDGGDVFAIGEWQLKRYLDGWEPAIRVTFRGFPFIVSRVSRADELTAAKGLFQNLRELAEQQKDQDVSTSRMEADRLLGYRD